MTSLATTAYTKTAPDGEAGCWSHARRKLWDIHERQHKLAGTLAHQALQRIGKVFGVEAEIRGKPPHERMRVRQEGTAVIWAT
jgi:transposase